MVSNVTVIDTALNPTQAQRWIVILSLLKYFWTGSLRRAQTVTWIPMVMSYVELNIDKPIIFQ